ncbi:uncharacterized protein [Typha latifolia]|uniref:uncharacterized protein isoform X1 n=1 Tax=Typha latifolia TaxID=4733 RepID=UPI003C2F9384
MEGVGLPSDDADQSQARPPPAIAADLISDDDRSVAADSWSIKSEYGSTLDDDQRHADAADVFCAANYPAAASDYGSDKDEADASEVDGSMLGLQSYWDASYSEDLANYHQHGHAGEVWFGAEVMDTVASWTKNLCLNTYQNGNTADVSNRKSESSEIFQDLSSWSVLDVGTGNGLFLQTLAKQGFSDLTGTDYSEGAIELARNLALRDGFTNIKFLVDDILETKLEGKFQLVVDKGTLDAIGLHPDGPIRRIMYWESLSNLVLPGGILVVTSCNNTRDELLQEVDNFNQRKIESKDLDQEASKEPSVFQYLDHVRTYPTIMFGGVEGSRVCTVALRRM